MIRSDAIPRRQFLVTAAAVMAATAITRSGAGIQTFEDQRIVDVNVSLSRWPTRRLPLDDPQKLAKKLRDEKVAQAWTGTFDALLHKDLRSANARLAEDCARHGGDLFLPFGSINPMLPDWEEDLQFCAEAHAMKGIRLHPNYHGYKLDDPQFARLLSLATERKLIVQIALHVEDERMMHPLMRVEPVSVAPLAEVLSKVPGARVVLLNALNVLIGEQLTGALAAGDVYVEIATLEGVAGLERLLATAPLARVLFGSHAPLFYFESAVLKLQESELTNEQLSAIRYGNALALMGR